VPWLILAFALAAAAEAQPVEWTNRVNVAAAGTTLKKTAGCEGCEDAGAVSWQMIPGGDGYVEFAVGEADTLWAAGLNRGNDSTWYGDIDFAFRFNGNGRADVIESGVYLPGDDISYKTGDVFRVAVVRGRVQYVKNGELIRESRRFPSFPLFLDVSLVSAGATVANATINTSDRDLTRSTPQPDRFASLGHASIAGELVSVGSSDAWIDTGLIVQVGDAIAISADGSVQLTADHKDQATPAGSRRRDPAAPLPQSPAGILLARIGNSAPIVIGAERRIPKSQSGGRLFLGINDAQLTDNTGAYRVTVTLQPR
jgi:hypothetical protein